MVLDPPSPFVVEWARVLLPRLVDRRRALDVAMGRGRHAAALAELGYSVFGVDIKLDAVRDAMTQGVGVRAWCADLTTYPLPREQFDLVVVTRYLQRDLFPSLREALAHGGYIIYETFTEAQRALGWGPTSRDHLLRPGELRDYFIDFDVLSYEEPNDPCEAFLVARRR